MNYNDLPGMRWSTLNNALSSALLLRHRISEGRADTAAMRFGRAAHSAILTPELFELEMVLCPDDFVTESGALSSGKKAMAWIAGITAPDPIIVTTDERDRCYRMRDAILDHESAGELLFCSDVFEQVYQWQESSAEQAIACKVKADAIWTAARLLWDLKTYGARAPISPRACISEIVHRMYHAQLGYYARGVPHEIERFAWVFVESRAPFDVVHLEADEDMIAYGRQLAEQALTVYATALQADTWPGAAPAKVAASLPAWMLTDDSDVADDLGLEVEDGD